MPDLPRPSWEMLQGEPCWTIDWREWFRVGLKYWTPDAGGEMRGFHVVFRIRINVSGTLVFWDDDGSIIRRNGQVVHEDRSAHPAQRNEMIVQAGDRLEIAQWQFWGAWLWGGRIVPAAVDGRAVGSELDSFLPVIGERLARPNGPSLKMYCSGNSPIRTIVSLYSMIINGYSPEEVLLFGDYQWSERSRSLFDALLPFARVVPTSGVLQRIEDLGGQPLAERAQRYWWVMKTCVTVLHTPLEFCLMDDDLFVLETVSEALGAFQEHDLVFAPDMDHSTAYIDTWVPGAPEARPLPTGRFNGGLFWMRNGRDLQQLAACMLQTEAELERPLFWDQGFVATQFVDCPVAELSARRFFFPVFDGLPGGILGYDYAANPCGFVSIHFGGLVEKPSDAACLALAPEILGRCLP